MIKVKLKIILILVFLFQATGVLFANSDIVLLTHNPLVEADENTSLKLSISVTNPENVNSVIVFFKNINEVKYKAALLFNKGQGTFKGRIPASAVYSPGLYYYIIARSKDYRTVFLFMSEDNPQYVKVNSVSMEENFGEDVSLLLSQGLSEELAVFRSEEQVISASGYKQKKSETPAFTTVLHRKDLLRLGAFQITDSFFYLPGVSVIRFNSGDHEVGMRGLNFEENKRTLTLVDNRPAYLDFFGITTYILFPMYIFDIEKIEFVHGPVSTIFGANAYSGAINIYLRDPKKSPGTYIYGAVGDNDFRSNVGGISDAGTKGKSFYLFSVGWLNSEQYQQKEYPEILKNINKPAARRWGSFVIGRDLSDGSVKLSGGGTIGSAAVQTRSFLFSNDSGYYDYVKVDFEKGNFKISSYYSEYDITAKNYLLPDASNLIGYSLTGENNEIVLDPIMYNTFVKGQVGDVDLSYNTIFKDKFRLKGTLSYRHANAFFPEFLDKKIIQNLLGLSLINEDRFFDDKLILNLSFRYDNHPLTGDHVSPRLAIIYKITDRQTIRLIGSSAYRNPSFIESNVNFQVPTVLAVAPDGEISDPPEYIASQQNAKVYGNENLKSETVNNGEINYEGFLFNSIKMVITGYYNQYNNLIDIIQVSDGNRFSNLGKAHGYGSEFSLEWHPVTQFKLFTNYTFSRTYLDYDNPYTLQNEVGLLKSQPEHIANIGIIVMPNNWELSLLSHFESEKENWRDNDLIPYLVPVVDPFHVPPEANGQLIATSPDVLMKIPPYLLLRVRVAYTFGNTFTVYAVGQNLLNDEHREYPRLDSQIIGRKLFGGFSYKF